VLYVTAPSLGGVNAGLVAVAINLALTFGLSRLHPAPERTPLSRIVLRSGGPQPSAERGAAGQAEEADVTS
jgi:solute:Na+ symporter, SSS family